MQLHVDIDILPASDIFPFNFKSMTMTDFKLNSCKGDLSAFDICSIKIIANTCSSQQENTLSTVAK